MTGQEVKDILTKEGVNQARLADFLGIKPQTLSARLTVKYFKESYMAEINEFVGKDLFGIGYSSTPSKSSGIPIYDIRACAGNGIGLESNENIIAHMDIPALRGCYGLQVYGDSMRGKYDSGDIIFVQPTDKLNFAWGRPHVIVTSEDILLKFIFKSNTNGNIRLVSYNNETLPTGDRVYPDREVFINDIQHIYIVRGSFKQESN